MDFSEQLNDGRYVSSVTSVTTADSDGADAGAASGEAVSDDQYGAEWTPPSMSAGGYVVTVTVATSDSETLVGTGVLQVI